MQRPVAFSRYSSTDTVRMAGTFCCRPDFFQTPFGISIEHGRISRFCQRKNTLSRGDCQGEGTVKSVERSIGPSPTPGEMPKAEGVHFLGR